MNEADALDRTGAAPGGRRSAGGARRTLRGATGGLIGAGLLIGTVAGCGEHHDPLTERCLEALAYHSPAHGRVERIERGPSPQGWAVTILHRAESAPGNEIQPFRCEYEVGNRWRFQRIAVADRELRRSEVARVNARLLL